MWGGVNRQVRLKASTKTRMLAPVLMTFGNDGDGDDDDDRLKYTDGDSVVVVATVVAWRRVVGPLGMVTGIALKGKLRLSAIPAELLQLITHTQLISFVLVKIGHLTFMHLYK